MEKQEVLNGEEQEKAASWCNTHYELIIKPYALRKDEYLLQFITPVKIQNEKPDPPFLAETFNLRYNHVSQIKNPKLILISRERKKKGF
ncbi:hypothetical protein ACJIZ3_013067 [Penstemon smallii]|uniref:Uncharacterized protein n=1 Tax=Penstemon smallii TaxID=265156 RepID=A0ABD3USB4_9LAMI